MNTDNLECAACDLILWYNHDIFLRILENYKNFQE